MKKTIAFVLVAMVSGIGFVHAEDVAQPAAAVPASPAVKVEKMAVGTSVDNKEIAGEAAQFPGTVGRLYAWSKVTTEQAPVTIKHVWYADGKKEAEVPLEIKYPAARTWSSKSVWPGSWKVEAVDDKGTVLSSKEFTVAKEAVQVGQ